MELHLYDFDGTLFRSPGPPDWWGLKSWFVSVLSLSPPCVPLKPGNDWWIGPTVASAKRSISDPDVWAILVTGRANIGSLRFRVAELLKGKGLNFDQVFLNTGGDTKAFKIKVILNLLRRHPGIQVVQIWEDRLDHLTAYIKAVEATGRVGIPHLVRAPLKAPECSPEDIEALEAQGWLKTRVASRWMKAQGEIYISAKLTPMARQRLLRSFPPIHEDVRADHMTVWYDPPEDAVESFAPLFGKRIKLKVVGVAQDDKSQAVVVRTRLPVKNRIPHITVSVRPGIKAQYSNVLLSYGYQGVVGPILDAVLQIDQ